MVWLCFPGMTSSLANHRCTLLYVFSTILLFLTFLNIHIYFIILKAYDQQFTLTTKNHCISSLRKANTTSQRKPHDTTTSSTDDDDDDDDEQHDKGAWRKNHKVVMVLWQLERIAHLCQKCHQTPTVTRIVIIMAHIINVDVTVKVDERKKT